MRREGFVSNERYGHEMRQCGEIDGGKGCDVYSVCVVECVVRGLCMCNVRNVGDSPSQGVGTYWMATIEMWRTHSHAIATRMPHFTFGCT